MSNYPIIIRYTEADSLPEVIQFEDEVPHKTYIVMATQDDPEYYNRLLEAIEIQKNQRQILLDKKTLILEVDVVSLEGAGEILCWMYGSEKPMKSRLSNIHWNSKVVSDEEYTLIEKARELFK